MAAPQAKPWQILVANGVNLDLLGRREPAVYGSANLSQLEQQLRVSAPELARVAGGRGVALTFFQSNDEAAFLNELSAGWDGALINPGAWTHTSLALADRLKGLALPFVEVHISNVAGREAFRQQSFSAPHAVGVVHGFGLSSYEAGLLGLLRHLAKVPPSSS